MSSKTFQGRNIFSDSPNAYVNTYISHALTSITWFEPRWLDQSLLAKWEWLRLLKIYIFGCCRNSAWNTSPKKMRKEKKVHSPKL